MEDNYVWVRKEGKVYYSEDVGCQCYKIPLEEAQKRNLKPSKNFKQ